MANTEFAQEITVKYVNEPKGAAISGSVKDEDGKYWSIMKEHLGEFEGGRHVLGTGYFQEGQPYQIMYWQKPGQNGMVWNNVVEANGVRLDGKTPAQPLPQVMQPQNGAPQPIPQNGAPAQQPAPQQPAPQQQAPAPRPNGDKERGMFIMGVVGRAMGSGQFSVNDVKLLTLAARDAWDGLDAPSRPI